MNKLSIKKKLSPKEIREGILKVEENLSKLPGAIIGHDNDAIHLPLKHTFVDGAYVREIFMPKGTLLTSKIHKIKHPYFVMKGECSVLTDEGVVRLKAPYQGITKPGTKRILYIHEDTIWITVHTNPDNREDLERIEERIIAKNFNDVQITNEEILELTKEE